MPSPITPTAALPPPLSEPGQAVESYQSRFADLIEAIDTRLGQWLEATSEPKTLWQAMQHGVLNGGKRLRPVLLIQSGVACGLSIEALLDSACALELLHCYSLIHDDLPCMDNDDLRRGKPTVHKVFGETTALLAGDALLALAFERLARQPQHPADRVLQLVQRLGWAASMGGLVTGQALDIEAENDPPTALTQASFEARRAALESIHRGKTGALFQFACQAGPILAGQPETVIDTLGRFGQTLGLAFQIKDDLLDEQSETGTLGKTTGKDRASGKLTFVSVFGLAEASDHLQAQLQEGRALLDTLPCEMPVEPLQYLLGFVESRRH
ncbi:MAG: polyprenyl synthetase family protein [Cyanobacteria bacterium HKST-UBA04]|nr:polyprenyl synthetase family protein [Cyanobacteria bacterium HKST-UBA04]